MLSVSLIQKVSLFQNGHIEPAELLARLLETEAGQAAELTMRDVTLVINRLDGFAGQKDGVLEKGEVRVSLLSPLRLANTKGIASSRTA